MTDLEMLKATLTQMGYKQAVAPDDYHRYSPGDGEFVFGGSDEGENEVAVTIGSGRGYVCFSCVFFFDKATGKSRGHACWE